MTASMNRRFVLQAGAVLGAGLFLPARQARACEFLTGGFRLVHPWTRVTEPGAEWALLCLNIDQVTEPDRLIGVETPVAGGAEMGGVGAGPQLDLQFKPGDEIALSEAGSYIKLTRLKQAIEPARAYPLTLHFEVAGAIAARLNVDFPSLRFR
jgi:copper(I)-binding protein